MSKPLPGSVGRSDARWRKLSRMLRYTLPPVCHLCGNDIDLTLDRRHKDSWTLDHVVPLAIGGDPYDVSNLRPAHRSCNSRGGAALTNGKRTDSRASGSTSRQW